MDFWNLFWKPVNEEKALKPFSIPHIMCLLIVILIILLIYIFKERLKKPKYEKKVSNIIGITLIFHQISIYIWYITNGKLNLKEALPLYLCRLSIILSIVVMLSKSRRIFDVLYFWGLGGASVALLFHDTSIYPFPHYIFIQFFISHGGILISVFFMIFVHEYTPNLNSLKKTIKWTIIYFCVTIPVNYLIDANYCYLRYRPYSTPLDYLPNNPVYFVPFIILGMCLLFFLLYLPFKDKLSF